MLKLFSKSLSDVLNETKTVKIKGVVFRIKKINALEYMMGYKVLKQVFDVYKTGSEPKAEDINLKNLEEIMKNAIIAGVVAPSLSFKENDNGKIHIDKLFSDWEIVNELYSEILEYSYGKKKVNKFSLLGKKL